MVFILFLAFFTIISVLWILILSYHKKSLLAENLALLESVKKSNDKDESVSSDILEKINMEVEVSEVKELDFDHKGSL